jgi:5-methylcytosine-specific restriction endonuclease McrA
MSPTARTLAHLRKLGYRAEKVEQRLPIPGMFVTHDLYNIGDVLAMRVGEPLLLIQCTTTAKLNHRMAKDRDTCRVWLSTGNRLQSIGKDFLRAALARDGYQCQRCGAERTAKKSLHVHHVKPWAGNPHLRFDLSNVVTVCQSCHGFIHSKKNVAREWIG